MNISIKGVIILLFVSSVSSVVFAQPGDAPYGQKIRHRAHVNELSNHTDTIGLGADTNAAFNLSESSSNVAHEGSEFSQDKLD